MCSHISRRTFGTLGAATALGAVLMKPEEVDASQASAGLDVRPYQLMCIVCRIGGGCTKEIDDAQLNKILEAVRKDRKRPLTLRCNVDSVFRYQNPGHDADTPEGELFNAKRDLDILHKLDLAPGDTRPAIDLFERLFDRISTTRGICGYEKATSQTWQGCPRATSGNYEKGCAGGIAAIIPARDPQEKAKFKKSSAAAIYEAKTLRIRPHHLMCMTCFYGGRTKEFAPIAEDNLFEAIDVVQKNPEIPIILVSGCCMICPPCGLYDPATNQCIGGRSMALRDEKKDLDVLQKLGLKYGDTMPAGRLFKLLYERIPSVQVICALGDGEKRPREWSSCDSSGKDHYQKARSANMGIKI
jgi:hypothetical protein